MSDQPNNPERDLSKPSDEDVYMNSGEPPRPEQIWPPPPPGKAMGSGGSAGGSPSHGGMEEIEGVIEEIRRINGGSAGALHGGSSTSPSQGGVEEIGGVMGSGGWGQTSCHVQAKSEAEVGQLWTNIFFSADAGLAGAPKTVVVTSCRRGDGATQIATSLALIGAEANKDERIALVDFNLRSPSISELLGISAQPGVTDVVEGRASLETAMQSVTLRNGTSLHVLAAGPSIEQPLSLLKSRQVKGLISRLAERYDHVIVDTASANVYPDAQVLGSMASGVLLVVRAGQTPRETVAEVKKRMDLAKVRCLGLVLNQRTDPVPDLVYQMT